MMKNLTLTMGNCNHRKYIPLLVEPTRTGVVDPSAFVTQAADVHDAVPRTRSSTGGGRDG